MSKYAEITEWQREGKTKVLAEQTNPVQLCPPQIPHGLAWEGTRASEGTLQPTVCLCYGMAHSFICLCITWLFLFLCLKIYARIIWEIWGSFRNNNKK